MLKTTGMILEELHQYASPADKLSRLVKQGKYIPIVKGLYETNHTVPGYLLAGSIYGPSYLSFEFALAYYGLIPEAVYTFTSATFEKKKKKIFKTAFGVFTYRDIPAPAYSYGVNIRVEGGYSYIIASPEKALCDQLYKVEGVKNYQELGHLLWDDLRIDEQELQKLNVADVSVLAQKYGSTNVRKLSRWLEKRVT
jgi:predicted transcriptional regulator of viral defense system